MVACLRYTWYGYWTDEATTTTDKATTTTDGATMDNSKTSLELSSDYVRT